MFKGMNNDQSTIPGRVMNLTGQTSNALDVSITGVQALIKLLLRKGMAYCLTVEFQSGYVSRKEGFVDSNGSMEPLSDKGCEFTVQLSRGGLAHPSKDMFDLAQCLYSYYEKVCNKSCTKRLLVAFRLLQETIQCSYSDSVLRRFVNTFSKRICETTNGGNTEF